jgi:hypothetical protein
MREVSSLLLPRLLISHVLIILAEVLRTNHVLKQLSSFPSTTIYPPPLSHHHHLPSFSLPPSPPAPLLSFCYAQPCCVSLFSPPLYCAVFFMFRYALPCSAIYRCVYVLSPCVVVYGYVVLVVLCWLSCMVMFCRLVLSCMVMLCCVVVSCVCMYVSFLSLALATFL